MKISELIEELEALKAKHGDLAVISRDDEGTFEVDNAHLSTYGVYDGKGSYDQQPAIMIC
jgi:hypothetical protein